MVEYLGPLKEEKDVEYLGPLGGEKEPIEYLGPLEEAEYLGPLEKPPTPTGPFLKEYYKWLHQPTEPATSFSDWFNRVVPTDISKTTIGMVEFPYHAVKTVTDPLYGFAKDVLIKGKDAGISAMQRHIEFSDAGIQMIEGFNRFILEPIGFYGWEAMKERWKTSPVSAVVAVAPIAKGMAKAPKPLVEIMPKRVSRPAELGKRTTLQKAYDWFDVQAPFSRIGAEGTGIAMKGFPSMKISEMNRFRDVAQKIKKLKLDEAQGAQLTLRAANTLKPEQVKPNINNAAKILDNYRTEAFKRLKQDGVLEYPWPESMMIRNRAKVIDLESAISIIEAEGKLTPRRKARIEILEKQLNELHTFDKQLRELNPKYVHIPLDVWFDKIRNELGTKAESIINTGFRNRFFKGRFFRQRKTIDIADVIDWLRELKTEKGKPIFTDLDFDARMINAAYAQKVGALRGLAKIFNKAKEEKILVSTKGGLPDAYGSFPLEMQLRFPELKNYYGHNAFIEYMGNYLKRVDKSMQLGRFFGYTKMMAFYNPFFLPAYDLWQATWIGAVSPFHPIRTTKNIAKGFKSVFRKDKDFYDASENGAFSTPYAPPFENFKRDIQGTIHHGFAERIYERYGNLEHWPVLDDFYKLVWNTAWKGDNAIRMGTYHYLRDRGASPLDAAQTTAYFHADYARLAPGARQILNKIWFTPTFKYTMGHIQANMIKSSVKVLTNAIRLKPSTTRDVMLAKGLVALEAGLLAQDYLFKHWGFETDFHGLRYIKRIVDDKGQEKELVVYVPNPNNVWLRQVNRWTQWGDNPERLDDFLNKAHWDLHPLWSTASECLINRKPDGSPVYNPFDDDSIKTVKIMDHALRRIIGAYGFIQRYQEEEGTKKAYKMLTREVGWLNEKILAATALAYLRQPKEVRKAWQMRKLQQLFRTYQYREYEKKPPSDKELQGRIDNFFKKIEEIQKEMVE